MVYQDIDLPLPAFIALDWTLMALALLPILVRLSLRTRNRGLSTPATNFSDFFIVLAWLAGAVLICINTWKNNLRMKYLNDPPETLYYGTPRSLSGHLLYVSWISLFFIYISLWASKAAFLALYYSIFSLQGKRIRIALAVACVFTLATFLMHMFLIAFWCSPISSNWSPPPGGNLCSAVHSIDSVTISTFTNVATDLVILAIPIASLMNTTMGRTERAGLAFVFLMGSVSIIAAIVRFGTLKAVQGVAKANITHTIDVWALVEIVSSILAVCLPSLRAFVRRHTRNTPHSQPSSKLGSRTGSRSTASPEMSRIDSAGDKGLGRQSIQEVWVRSEDGERMGLGLRKLQRDDDVEALIYVRRPEEVKFNATERMRL